MLTCKDFLGWLNEFLDGTAGDEIRRELESHVNACPNCWVIFDTTKKTIQVYKGMDPHPLPSEIESRLLAALEKKFGGAS